MKEEDVMTVAILNDSATLEKCSLALNIFEK